MTEQASRTEIDRGYDFAQRVVDLVLEHGPADFTRTEKDAMADHLLDASVAFVRSRNVAVSL